MTVESRGHLQDADLSLLSIPRPEGPDDKPRLADRRRLVVWAGGAIAVVVIGYGLASLVSPRAIQVEVALASPLRTAGRGQDVSASGYVVAQRQAQLASKGTGRLEYLGVQVGDQVKAGQIVARLEQADMVANVHEAQAKLEVAKAALANAEPELQDARVNHGRLQALLAQTFATQAEFDMAEARLRRGKAAVRSAEAAIKAATAEVQAAEVQMRNTNIHAPFDGTIVKKYAEVGEVVAPLAASAISRGAVVLIADLTSLVVEAEISESMIGQIRVGQTADITLDAIPGHRYRGEVGQIVPTADRTKATVLTKIRFLELSDRVYPEMSAKVTVQTAGAPDRHPDVPPGIGLPKAAVAVREGQTLVFAVQDGIVQERTVQVGPAVGDLIEVHGGVGAGDEVVLSPPARLKTGDAVNVLRKDP